MALAPVLDGTRTCDVTLKSGAVVRLEAVRNLVSSDVEAAPLEVRCATGGVRQALPEITAG